MATRRAFVLYMYNHRTKEGGFVTHDGQVTPRMTKEIYLDKDEAVTLASHKQSKTTEIVMLRTFL